MTGYRRSPVGAHYGSRGWLLQRLTAVVMALYTVYLGGCLVLQAPATHAQWKELFTAGFMRVATMFFFAALLYHAWIGMRDIVMDYVKPPGMRLAAQFAIGAALLFYLIWSASILWGR